MNTCSHTPNGLGARDENGRMICGRCHRPYDVVPTPAGDLNKPWESFPTSRAPEEFDLGKASLSGGVLVFGAVLHGGPLGHRPVVIFKFARADGTGFYEPMALLASTDELRSLAVLVDQATAQALVAVHQANGGV